MKNEEKFYNISSKYCLKSIFSYLKYNYILKLIKNNKKLQKELGFNLYNYKTISSYQYIKRKIIRKEKYINYNDELFQLRYITSVITLVPVIYISAYSSILYFEGPFNEDNLKENYDEKSLNIIKKIIISLFILVGIIIFSLFIITCFIFKNYYTDTKLLKKIKIVILLIIIFIYAFYEILIIYKIFLSYKIKENKIKKSIIYDYILISIILLYIIFMIYIYYRYYKFGGTKIQIYNKIILKKYKDIKISDFELPLNFHNMSKQNKKQFILKNRNKLQYKHSERHKYLINLINEYRIKNNLNRLIYNEEEKIPEFLANNSSEMMFLDFKNLFKLSYRKYLFKYKINEFEKNFIKKDINIINIILNKDLNKISIIDIGNYDYIQIYDSYNDFKVNLIEAKSGIPVDIDRDIYNETIEDLYYNE